MASTTRLTRVIASSTIRLTRQWRHFCTEASSPQPRAELASPRVQAQVWMYRSGRPSLSDVLSMWDSNELEQMEEFERNQAIFLQTKPSHKQLLKFLDQEYDKMKRNETKYPGELKKILKGNFKGWRLYKPTLEEIPKALPTIYIPRSLSKKRRAEWQRIFMENREMWYKKGLLDIIFEGNVFDLGTLIEKNCLDLTEGAAFGIPWQPIQF